MHAALKILDFDGASVLRGSAARRVLFPSDVDIEATLSAATAAAQLRRAIGALVHTPLVRVVDIKAGGFHYSTSQALNPSPHGIPSLETALEAPDRVKLDCIAWDDTSARFVSLEALILRQVDGAYVGEAPSKPSSLKAALREDVESYARDGNYFKALKRLERLYTLEKRTRKAADLTEALDGRLGALGQLVGDLRALALLCDHAPPRARLYVELSGIAPRLERIAIEGLEAAEPWVMRHIDAVRAGLKEGVKGTHAAGAAASAVADRINKALQAASHAVYDAI